MHVFCKLALVCYWKKVALPNIWVSKEQKMKQNEGKWFSSMLCSQSELVSNAVTVRCSDVLTTEICMVMCEISLHQRRLWLWWCIFPLCSLHTHKKKGHFCYCGNTSSQNKPDYLCDIGVISNWMAISLCCYLTLLLTVICLQPLWVTTDVSFCQGCLLNWHVRWDGWGGIHTEYCSALSKSMS